MTFLRRASLFFVSISLLAHVVRAQSPCPMPPTSEIPNFQGTTNTTSYTIKWDPLPNNPEALYEVMQATAANYCLFPNPSAFTRVGTTNATTTTYTGMKSDPNVAYFVFVWLQSDHCVATHFTLVADTFSSPPSKPVITSAVGAAASATITFSYNDSHAFEVEIIRQTTAGQFLDHAFANVCDPDPKVIVDNGSGTTGLPPGTYQYKLVVYNNGNSAGLSGVASDPKTAVVGGGAPLRINSFAATPPTIRAGQPAILSWRTQGATSVMIDKVTGTQPLSGSVSVNPSATTTYTLTAMAGSNTVTSTATVNVLTAPTVVVSAFPSALLQAQGAGGAITSYTLTNAGGSPTNITLNQNGSFFTQTPTVPFTLDPGQSKVITITGLAQSSPGSIQGASSPTGAGVPSGLQVPIKLLTAAPPTGTVTAAPTTNRVDVNQPGGGSVIFSNDGDATLTGILVSDVPWIIPQGGVVTIPPHSTFTVTFTIDRAQRPDSAALVGSASGNLSLVYLSGPAAKVGRNEVAPVSVSFVTVVDTVTLNVSQAAPPALVSGEVALFVPGVGHTPSSVGTFISDVSILNPLGTAISDLRFYYTPRGQGTTSSQSAAVTSVPSSVSVALADVAKNVFGVAADVGSLQIRSSVADKLGVSTNIFVSSNPKGTFGTSIPTFRSDRAVGAGEKLFLTGLAQQPTLSHTNLFIQETAGVGVSVHAEFLSADGSTLKTDDYNVGPFTLSQIGSPAPSGTVSAIMTNTSTGSGRFLAYATPVDEKSSDTWSVVDWSRQFGYSQGDAVVVPVAGRTQGISGFFRTDAAIMNTGSTLASGTLRYVSGNTVLDRQITLGGQQTTAIPDLTGTLFGITTPTVGYLVFTPVNGTFAITSRTYATLPNEPGTFGSATPTLALAAALKNGSLRAIGSLEDALPGSVKRPATFRTNFGLSEVTGNSVTVRVTLRFTYPAGAKVQGIGTAFKDYNLSANQYLQVNGMAGDILGANRTTVGDLRGFEADFQVIDGTGAVTVFTSSVDNGTADSILRTE